MSEPQRVRLRSGIQTINGITGETGPLYSEYVLASDYDALRAEVELLKVDLDETIKDSHKQLAEVERLKADAERLDWVMPILDDEPRGTGDSRAQAVMKALMSGKTGRAAIDAARAASPTDPSPASAPGNPPSPAPPPSAG